MGEGLREGVPSARRPLPRHYQQPVEAPEGGKGSPKGTEGEHCATGQYSMYYVRMYVCHNVLRMCMQVEFSIFICIH